VNVIVVGVDGSPNSQSAVEWAVAQARRTGAEVVAVHALGLLEKMDPDSAAVPAQPHLHEIEEMFKTVWCAPLAGAGVAYRTELRYGSSVPVLLEIADITDAELIVVGSRGLGATPELLLGSTSTQVAQHARRPVTIVPA
jgi:nucleotide-binding universal stress UspA family protein